MEIKNMFKMKMNDKTMVVNEYGTNLVKYKYDPLAVIEAKFVMTQGKRNNDKCQSMSTKGNGYQYH
jgi:predicted GNAT superfamily acetyltransferase